ncbi:prepilin-type N-terminal cleavage/methylation domain-containing protein [Candidatus Shapirobacteria bacterium]|nr:prepilin-type N-terminal cleavage/methylation domain-containing protein [Candidatus Shapirobacteria bacterium]
MNRLLLRQLADRNDAQGFSLVELMVAVSISIVVMSGLAVSVSSYFAKEKMKLATSELVSMINLARSMAVTGQVTSGFTKLDYVAVTLSATGVVSAFPVNNISGTGPSYFSKDISAPEVTVTQINFGTLQFASGSGKIVGKDLSPLFTSYPVAPNFNVGITLSSVENSGTSQIVIGPLGTVAVTSN